MVHFFIFLNLFNFCFIVAIFDLVHEVEATYTWPMLTANMIWNFFLKYE